MYRCLGYGECAMVFRSAEDLARHVRTHTGERPFACHCGRYYSRLDNIRRHIYTVHPETPELNAEVMKKLEKLYKELLAYSKKSQIAMGMVVRRRAPYPTRKPKVPLQMTQGTDFSEKEPLSHMNRVYARSNHPQAIHYVISSSVNGRKWEEEWRAMRNPDER